MTVLVFVLGESRLTRIDQLKMFPYLIKNELAGRLFATSSSSKSAFTFQRAP